jgi:hypothetical protein
MREWTRARPRLAAALAACLGLAAAGCAGDGIRDPASGNTDCFDEPAFAFDPKLSCVQEFVLTPRCAIAGCHAAPAAAGLSLVEGRTFGETVNVLATSDPNFRRVEPGDPNDSYVVMKLAADPRIVGQRMPFGAPPLGASEMTVVGEWIARGAMDD